MVRPAASTGSGGRRSSSSNGSENDGSDYSIDEIRRLRPALTARSKSSANGARAGKSKSKTSQTTKASKGGRIKPSSSNNNANHNMDAFRLRNRLEREERARGIPATLSIVRPFPATPAAATSCNAGTAGGAHNGSNGAARTPHGGRRMAGPAHTPHGNRMRRADAGHTPGAAFYLPPSLADNSTFAATNGSTTFAAAAQPRSSWNDGVSPLAFGAEARPVRTKAQQLAREESERDRVELERRRRREAMLPVGRANETEEEEEDRKGRGTRGGGKKKNPAKDNGGRRRTFEVLRKKRSEAYAVDADGLLVVQRTVSEDNHARINRVSSCSAGTKSKSSSVSSSKKSKSGRSSAKMMTKAKPARKAVAASLRTLGKRGLRAAKRGALSPTGPPRRP